VATSDNERLEAFITAAKERGVADDFIVALLKQNGWSERRIFVAFSLHYERVLGSAVPARGGRVEYASDAFSYLLAFISLCCWACATGAVFYALIDRWFPDKLDYDIAGETFRDTVSWELATIIVAFPIFAFVSRSIATNLRRTPERAESGVRKWLTYLALVLAAVALLGDGIAFLNAFLTGALTVRFVLQTVVLLTLAGGIFTYYLLSVRGEPVALERDRIFAGIATVAAGAALILGFVGVGTPAHMRQLADDRRRVDDLNTLETLLTDFRANHPRLPPNLAELDEPVLPKDPVSGKGYTYRPLDASHYQLCATFETDSDGYDARFPHGSGLTCFKRRYAKG